MAIANIDQLIAAFGSASQGFVIDKAALANAAAGQDFSLWRATGVPAQGAIPGAAAACTSALVGALPMTNQTDPIVGYLAGLSLACSIAGQAVGIHDRLAHMGGLSFNSTATQTVGLDLTGVSAARQGMAGYMEVQWWLDVYTDGGATASNATISVDLDDASTVNLTTVAVGGPLRAGRAINLNLLIPSANAGRRITKINSVTLSAATGTAGSFGFTATRARASLETFVANKGESKAFDVMRMPRIENDSCLEMRIICLSTTTGTVRGGGTLIYG